MTNAKKMKLFGYAELGIVYFLMLCFGLALGATLGACSSQSPTVEWTPDVQMAGLEGER